MTAPPHSPDDGAERRRARRAALGDASSVVIIVLLVVHGGLRRHPPGDHAADRASRPSTRARLHLARRVRREPISAARVEPDGSVTVRAIGQQYSFTPPCIAGAGRHARSRFRATSADVVHGFLIERHQHQHHAGAGLRLRASPRASTKPGEHLMPCHEFCGVGHEGMWAQGQGDRQGRVHAAWRPTGGG